MKTQKLKTHMTTKMTTKKDGKEIPKEFLCQCCGNDVREEKVIRIIRVNRENKPIKFCCMEAGGIYQMGCEG